jgi:hypothetical protein
MEIRILIESQCLVWTSKNKLQFEYLPLDGTAFLHTRTNLCFPLAGTARSELTSLLPLPPTPTPFPVPCCAFGSRSNYSL